MILILSEPDDEHARIVAEKLKERGVKLLWFDHGQYPKESQISLSYSVSGEMQPVLRVGGERYDLNRVTAAWRRRPSDPGPHAELTDGATREHVRREAKSFLNDVWHSLDC